MRLAGRVVRVDRASQRVECVTSGSTGTLRAPYPNIGRPPPPLSSVLLGQTASGQWSVADVTSPRRELFHDDFSSAVDFQAIDSGAFGDTNWRPTALVPYAYGQQSGAGGDSQGVANLNTNAGVQNIAKDVGSVAVTTDPALWLSSRFCTSTGGISFLQCGFGAADALINATATGAFDNAAFFRADATSSAGQAQLVTAQGTSSGSLLLPFFPTDTVFFDIDIVVVGNDPSSGGGFASMWINGDGPYTTTTFTPTTALPTVPFFGIGTTTAGTADIRIDWMHCETVRNVTSPARLYDLSPTGSPT